MKRNSQKSNIVTLKQEVYEYLENQVLFRERKNKDRGIVNLLIIKYPILKGLDKDTLVAIMQDFNSMDRYWRMILDKERSDLRGEDYETKNIVEQRKELELGYEVGYTKDVSHETQQKLI